MRGGNPLRFVTAVNKVVPQWPDAGSAQLRNCLREERPHRIVYGRLVVQDRRGTASRRFRVRHITPEVRSDTDVERLPDLRNRQEDAVAGGALGLLDLANVDETAACVDLEPVAVPTEFVDRVMAVLVDEPPTHSGALLHPHAHRHGYRIFLRG